MSASPEEVEGLRARLDYLQEALDAVAAGSVDAVLASPDADGQTQMYALTTADRPYRALVEGMGQGAATTTVEGLVLFSNRQLAGMLGVGRGELVGRDLWGFVDEAGRTVLESLLALAPGDGGTAELELSGRHGGVPVLVTASTLQVESAQVCCLVVTDLTERRRAERLEEERREQQREERLQLARDVNDSIVQGLVAAEMALDLGQHDRARANLSDTSARARSWIGELVEGDLEPGMAVRHEPSGPGSGSDPS